MSPIFILNESLIECAGSVENNNIFSFPSTVSDKCNEIADDYAIEFAEWKDDNFLMYRDKTYYTKTSSPYFDVTKYVGKEKPTKYYTLTELLEIFKKEKDYE